MQVFVDSEGSILATHDESNPVPANTYDKLGKGETKCVYVDLAKLPLLIMSPDGDLIRPRFKKGWEENHVDSIPTSITNTQGRLAIRKAGLSKKVAEAIDAIENEDEREDVRIRFESTTWKRSDPMFEKIGDNASPKITAEQFDNIFREARKL